MSTLVIHLEQEREIPTCWWADAVAREYTREELDAIDMYLIYDPGELPVTRVREIVSCRECLEWMHS